MKVNQSLTVRTAGTMAASQTTHRITGVLAMYRTAFALVAVVLATVVGIGVWNATRPAAPAAPATASQTLSPQDIATLPWRIQNQVAGTAHEATIAVAPVVLSGHDLRTEYVATLPFRIQNQVAGTVRGATSRVAPSIHELRPEYVATLPAKIQKQVAGTVQVLLQ